MLQINGKTFMNLQEAVQWLLDNNALPFQSSANYIANTEIGLGTIINPSPAKVRIGSLIFFADSKVSTVTGLTENGFIVSDQYNDLVDDVVYVSNVQLNASDHLIVTLSNGDTIDAGIIKQVSGFSINGSQHLIVSFNDGTTTDLGAIFNGNVNISGDLTVTGVIDGGQVTGDEIIEKMSGYSFTAPAYADVNFIYSGVAKTGDKISFVQFVEFTPSNNVSAGEWCDFGTFTLPLAVANKLIPYQQGVLTNVLGQKLGCAYSGLHAGVDIDMVARKETSTTVLFGFYPRAQMDAGTRYLIRFENTFLLSENLAS